jgi:hypothetical protein
MVVVEDHLVGDVVIALLCSSQLSRGQLLRRCLGWGVVSLVTLRDRAGCAHESRRRVVLRLVGISVSAAGISTARAAPDQPVAHLSDFAEPWSAVKFTLPDADGGDMPCIVIRLPGDKWYALSLICPHNKCTIMYVPDVDMARDSFNVETSTTHVGLPVPLQYPAQGGRVIGGPAPNPRFNCGSLFEETTSPLATNCYYKTSAKKQIAIRLPAPFHENWSRKAN